jgi:hypothetical protein
MENKYSPGAFAIESELLRAFYLIAIPRQIQNAFIIISLRSSAPGEEVTVRVNTKSSYKY